MEIELAIDRNKEIAKCAIPMLEKELLTRMQAQVEGCTLEVRLVGADRLSVRGGEKEAKKKVKEILQQTWESADKWFC